MGTFSPADSSNTAETARAETSHPAGQESVSAPLAHALAMARHGYRVFPAYGIAGDGHCTCPAGPACANPGKHPRVRGWRKLATSDPGRIAEFWRAWPDANPGIAPDANPGIAPGPDTVVVDIDGMAGLAAYLGHAGLASLPGDTLVVRSGSGAPGKVHVYHSLPEGVLVKNGKQSTGGISRLVETDIKTAGGFVVGPGGIHRSGRPYLALSWGGTRPTPIPPSLLDLLGKKGVSPPSSGPCATRTAPKAAPAPNALQGHRKAVVGQANPKQVSRLLHRVTRRFPITARGQRDEQVYRMVGHLLGTGHRPADVQAVGREWLDHFHERGLIATPIEDCYTRLDDQISHTLTRENAGEFAVMSEREHVARARAPGLSGWLDLLPDSLLRPHPPTQTPGTGNGLVEQEIGNAPVSPDSSLPLSLLPSPRHQAAGTRERFRGTRTGRVLSDQERSFCRAVLSWVAYKLLGFPQEGEILLTDGQIRKLMAAWGCPVDEEGPTVRRLKAKFFTQGRDEATVAPLLVRKFKGRMVHGTGEPSRYVLSPALAEAILSLPEPGEPAPDWLE